LKRAAAFFGLVLLGLLVAVAGVWGVLVLAVAGPTAELPRMALAAAFGAAALAALVSVVLARWRRPAVGAFIVLWASVLVWYFSLVPRNDRDWVADHARLTYATVQGDFATVHHIRNFAYRTETDFTPAYYDKRFDLRKIEGVDLVATYWMGPAIAHIFLSFAFEGGEHLAVSIETRREKGEGYSAVKGFFRQYELYYAVTDERDAIRLRTNVRQDPPEQVYMYRVKASKDKVRHMFLDYLDAINALQTRPRFYNSLTTNCTTTIWQHSLIDPEHLSFDWRILASGYLPQYLYEQGRLEGDGLPFAELQKRAFVNPRAQEVAGDDDFSARIRRVAKPAEAAARKTDDPLAAGR
jgi:hypothetical protein